MSTPITTRELRKILFDVKNQEMTVEQLRHALFAQHEQDGAADAAIQAINVDQAKTGAG